MRNRIALLTLPLLGAFFMGCTEDATVTGAGNQTSSESISAVIPNKVFLGRMVDVTVSGFGTKWTDATKVDFGANINVLNQTVASPTAIVATIDIGPEATLGPRDVNVTDADGTWTYKGAFKLESPLDLVLSGTVAQGSVVVTKAKQLDLTTPFDTTSTGDGFFEPLVYTNVSVSGSAGIHATVDSVDLYSTALVTFLDVDAPAGKGDLTVNSGPVGDTIPSPAPGGLDIAARMPDVLAEGGSAKGKIDAPLATLLFSFTPSGPGVYSIVTTANSSNANPNLAVLPKSGHFAEMLDYAQNPTLLATNSDPFYLVYWDNSGTDQYTATLKATKVVTSDIDPNDTCATAQAAGPLPAMVKNLYMSSEMDIDWFSIDVPAGSEGKIIHVKTLAGDVKTDTVVDVLKVDCVTSLGGPSSDGDYHEDFKSAPIVAAGKHFVKVSNSTYGYTGKLYDLSIAIEDPPPPMP